MKYSIQNYLSIKLLKLFNYLILVLIFTLIYFFIDKNNNLNNSKNIIYVNSEISQIFYSNLPKDLKLLKNYLNTNDFIESYEVVIKKNELHLSLSTYPPFAINNINDKIIFKNGVISESIFFNNNFINNIQLQDISLDMSSIDPLFIQSLYELNNFKQFYQIQLIDNRRFDLYLFDGRKIMLPKIFDKKLIIFLNKNLSIFMKNDNFKIYLDLRNFLNDSVRMK